MGNNDTGTRRTERIQALMGHSTIKVTMGIYGHLMSDGDNEAAQRIAELVFGAVLPKSGSKMVARGKNGPAKNAASP